jgi:fucose 4-O-acetylase-like acetyltransferase
MGVLTNRRQDIEQAKGLAILFVVFGHIVARADPLRVEWYEPIRRAIYAFHMPFFLYLSGIVAVLSGALFTPPAQWAHLLRARARRLLAPFFALGALTVAGKVAAAHFVFVDNQPASLAAGLGDLLWHTANSPALSIWYLFVLFALSIVAPILVWADHGRLRYLLISGLCIYFLPLPPFLYLDHIGKYAVFFGIGAWAAGQGDHWNAFVDRSWPYFLIVLLCAVAAVGCCGAAWPVKMDLLPIGFISMPALHGLVRNLPVRFAPIFLWLGRNSFMIYLFNTICIGLAKGLLLRVTSWDGAHFLPFAIALMISGSLGPILLKKTIFARYARGVGGAAARKNIF